MGSVVYPYHNIHVIITSKRVVPRFLDLTEEEASDLVLTTKRVGSKLEPHYNATSLTFAIQVHSM